MNTRHYVCLKTGDLVNLEYPGPPRVLANAILLAEAPAEQGPGIPGGILESLGSGWYQPVTKDLVDGMEAILSKKLRMMPKRHRIPKSPKVLRELGEAILLFYRVRDALRYDQRVSKNLDQSPKLALSVLQ